MKHSSLLLVTTLLLLFPGCSSRDSAEKISADLLSVTTKLNDILEAVHDESDAKAAIPKIEATAKRMKAIAERLKQLPLPTEADKKAASNDLEERKAHTELIKAQTERGKAIRQRLGQDRAIMAALEPAMRSMSDALLELTKAQMAASRSAMQPPPDATPSGRPGPSRSLGMPPAGSNPAFEMGRQQRLQQLIGKHGKDRVAMIEINGLAPAAHPPKIMNDLKTLAKATEASMMPFGSQLTIFLAPVPDLKDLAQQIKLGKVTGTDPDKRLITISASGN
jgi:hypothetical protein